MIDGERVELNRTFENQDNKLEDGTITHTRTLEFLGIGTNYKLKIERMSYSKDYDKTI